MSQSMRMRKGSALLIVLGLTAFMIVSAVAFSAYMRRSRLPSSYLRRSTTSRELIKAALARAIDEIDVAINNNPHPNIGSQGGGRGNYNKWMGRVFMATSNSVDRVKGGLSGDQDPNDTVPTLSLDALAYIPPPLINEARYYSRRTPTAIWKTLDFDAGRYAYTAIDISDFYDVNRLFGNHARSSAANYRLSLSYLLEEGDDHASADSTNGGKWDTFMEKFRTQNEETLELEYEGKTPLVSLADFNLAFADKHGKSSQLGPFRSWLVDYLEGDTSFATPDVNQLKDMLRMPFATDALAYEGATNGTNSAGADYFDLTKQENQPFTPDELKKNSRKTLMNYMQPANADVVRELANSLPYFSIWALADYLDEDNIPVSLGIPTAERAPMICGAEVSLNNGQVKINEKKGTLTGENGGALVTEGNTRRVERIDRYSFDGGAFASGIMASQVKLLSVYPFARAEGFEEDKNFSIEGRLLFFLTDAGAPMKMRTGNQQDFLHWGARTGNIQPQFYDSTSLMIVPLDKHQIQVKSPYLTEREAVTESVITEVARHGASVATALNDTPFLTITYQWDQRKDAMSGQWTPSEPSGADNIASARCLLPPLSPDGKMNTRYAADVKEALLEGRILRLQVALQARIVDNQNKTVDLVPAAISDDELNQVNNFSALGPAAVEVAGSPGPLLLLDTGVNNISFKWEDLTQNKAVNGAEAGDVQITPSRMIVADPRWNHAPEHWFKLDDDLNPDNWLKENHSTDSGRDGDIFMAVSNQQYLQSIYELAALPRLSDLSAPGANAWYGNAETPDDGRAKIADNFGETRNQNVMWRTYNPFAGDDFDFLREVFTSGQTGLRVNPFSDSTNVLMAAFANTPVSWACASTNNTLEFESMDASQFNQKYAWNAYASDQSQRFAWRDLEAIAGKVKDAMQSVSSYNDWTNQWNALDWKGSSDTFVGVDLDSNTADLWNSDRKFLYGYWRECFEPRQQLFLVFVRAEPMMMGGGMGGEMPPQLAGKAVALVWRDPRPTQATGYYGLDQVEGYPHRTRILFYKNLE